MARIKAKRIYHTDQAVLVELRKEYIMYGDWDTRIEPGCLTIYPRYRTDGKEKKAKNKRRPKRT